MKIHLLSDIHNEFDAFEPYFNDADLIILAGDIDLKTRGMEWAKNAFERPVLYIAGNHEYYGGHLEKTVEKLRLASNDHVQFLDFDEVVIGGIRFLGVTGWTDYSATGNKPMAEWDAQQKMTDFKKIRTGGYRRTRPKDFADLSRHAKLWLREKFTEPFDGPTVVVTHHAPSILSLSETSDGSHLDAAYANRWEDLMGDHVDLWVHGHSHAAVDYEIAGTRVISNPRGYPGESTGFNDGLIIPI